MELKPGLFVCYRKIWHGMILDVLKSEYTGKIILHILFVKNAYKRQNYDTIEYVDGSLTETTLAKIEQEIGKYETWKQVMLDKFRLSLGDRGE